MANFSASIKGFEEIMDKIDPVKFQREIQGALDDFGLRVEKKAKLLAPKDEGALAQSINHTSGTLSVTVSVNKDYAAYVEFGTRKFAQKYVSTLPNDWKEFAAKFKGSGGSKGSFMSFFYTILKWVQRKGIAAHKTKSGNRSNSKSSIQAEYSAAYLIALKILREGIKPQPFLYPAFTQEEGQLLKDLQNIIE